MFDKFYINIHLCMICPLFWDPWGGSASAGLGGVYTEGGGKGGITVEGVSDA